MKQQLISFKPGSMLQNLVEYTDGIESCLLYRIWCAVYSMSCHLGRKAWVRHGRFKLYPNFYIVLIGDAGVSRKTTALSILMEDFIYDTCPYPFLEGSITKSRLLTLLSKKKENNTVNICVSELSVMMTDDKLGIDLISTLTDLFDCRRKTTQITQARGLEEAKEPCVNLLGASTREWVNTNMPQSFVEGGFASRCIFVVYLGKISPVATPIITDYQHLVAEQILEQYNRLTLIEGEFPITKTATQFLEIWYNNMHRSMDKVSPKLIAYFSRKQLHMIKLSMLIAISENCFTIDHEHVKQAHDLLHHTETNMEYAFEGLGDFRAARLYDRIYRLIVENGGSLLHSAVCREVSKLGTRKDVAEAVAFLEEAEKITVEFLNKKRIYKIIKKSRKISG